jgi:peptide/nickel transport system permease protein
VAARDALSIALDAEELDRKPRGRHLWILRRAGFGLVVLLVTSIVVFAATQALPGDAARAILGRQASPAQVAELRAQLGGGRPLVTQFADWLSGVVRGDLGTSLAAKRPVGELIGDRAVNSLALVLFTATLAIPVAVGLGALCAYRRDGTLDKLTLVASFALTALPEFVVGLLLLILFSTTLLTLFPAVALIPPGETAFGHPDQLVLPVATLALVVAPYLLRLARGSMIEVLDSEYVRMAWMKGLSPLRVVVRHALPNSLTATIQACSIVLAYLLGGIVVVEYLFNFPGLGLLLVNAVSARDVPVIQAVVLIFAAGVVVFNLVADVVTTYINPRLRRVGR